MSEVEVKDSEFPSMEEAVLMSRGIKTSLGSRQPLGEHIRLLYIASASYVLRQTVLGLVCYYALDNYHIYIKH
jgi:hypothetical protein